MPINETPDAAPSASSPSPSRPSIVAITAGAVLTLACVATQWNIDGNRRVDLRIYLRAMASSDSGHLYDYGTRALNFLYPPVAAIVLRPLELLGEDAATRLWLVLSVALGLVVFGGALSTLDGPRRPSASAAVVVAAACLWSVPTYLSFRMGQINPLIAALVVVDVVAISRRSRFGGVAIGVAAALKVTPLVLIAALLWSCRRRDGLRALATFVVTGVATAIVLPHETWRFWTRVVFEASDIGGADNPFNASVLSLTGIVTSNHATQQAMWFVTSAALVVLVAHGAQRLGLQGARRRFEDDVLGAVVVVMNLTYLVSPLTWVHHQWFATVALLVWVVRARRPLDWIVVAVGVLALVDPLALGESSMLRTVLLVAFSAVSAVALPTATRRGETDFPEPAAITQDVPGHREERANHA